MSVIDTRHSTFPGKNNGSGRLKVYRISLQLRELAQLVLRGLVYSRAQHPPALERADLNRGNNKPVFAMWVLNEGGDPVS